MVPTVYIKKIEVFDVWFASDMWWLEKPKSHIVGARKRREKKNKNNELR